MEILDVVDEWGNPTGETVERTTAHAKGYRHRTAHVWLVRNYLTQPEILLQKRSDNKDSFPGCYDISSAGHIPAGVDFLPSAVRELSEELGVTAGEEELIFCGQCYERYERIFYGKKFIDDQVSNVYLLLCPPDMEETSFRLQEEEVSGVRWMELSECMKAVGDHRIRHCIRLNELEMVRQKLRTLQGETGEGFAPEAVCGVCRGHCCRTLGCSLGPEDLLRALKRSTANRENLLEVLIREPYAIDRFSEKGRDFYYLRMRHKCFTFIGVDAMGECEALGPEGCTLPYEERPRGGRMLEAKPDRHCFQHYTREQMIADWEPYQTLLADIWKEYEAKLEADGTFDRCEEACRAFQMEKNRRM